MPARIKNRGIIAYGGGWRYKDPHGGKEFFQVRFEQLVDKVRDYRRDNGFPIGLEFEKEIEEQLCLNHPDECSDLPPGLPYKTLLHVNDVVRGSQVMIRFWAAGKPLVSQEEANRRAAICSRCGLNDEYSRPCSGLCGELKALVSAVVNGKGTPYDSELKTCRICKCFLAASVFLPLEIQCSGVTEDMKEHFKYAKERFGCWKTCE